MNSFILRVILNLGFFVRLLRNPTEYIQPFCDAVTEVTRSIDPKFLKEGEQVVVGFDGPFVSRRVTPRDLLSQFIGSMVCVEGIITKCNFSLYFLPLTTSISRLCGFLVAKQIFVSWNVTLVI